MNRINPQTISNILRTVPEPQMPEYNDKNIEKLAEEVTDSVDMDALRQHFYEDQYDYFKNDKEAFLDTWDSMAIDEEPHESETRPRHENSLDRRPGHLRTTH